MKLKLTLALALLLTSLTSMAADLSQLAAARTWQKLLHMPAMASASEIETPSFFLAKNGAVDAEAELRATLRLFHENAQQMCRFPARAAWLAQQQLLSFDYRQCDKLMQWLGGQTPDSVSVVFADGFLENPASFYGHLLIRVGSTSDTSARQLMANSFNFGARVPHDEDPVSYIIKGLVGGYRAAYSTTHFYRYDINYAEAELRNLWNYRLSTSPAQSRLLIWHLWELLQTDYAYFFSSRNCAYHMARALELVTDSQLVQSHDPFVLPADIIQRLNEATIDGHAAIAKRHLQPSRLYQFQQRWSQLIPDEKALLNAWLRNPGYFELTDFPAQSQQKVADVLTDFYAYRLHQLDQGTPEHQRLQREKQQLLRQRMLLPMTTGHDWQLAEPSAPESAQAPGLLRFGLDYTDTGSDSATRLSMNFRPAYYDVLQRQQGRLPNATLTMAELGLSADRNSLELEHFWLLRLHTLNESVSGLPGDGGASWGLELGWQRDRLRQPADDLSPIVTASYGHAFRIKNERVNLSLRTELRDPSAYVGGILAAPQLQWLSEGNRWRSQCTLRYEFDPGSRLEEPWYAGCEMAWHIAPQQDIRLSVARQKGSRIQLGWSWYW
ncbi:DUF4105 domain-containing protein [Pseudidiomarina insulisalsae]|nr:DUF4105 domain-containing protein [Pseudidiomarina insulisalsae]